MQRPLHRYACVRGCDCLRLALLAQLPTLKRLDLRLRMPHSMHNSDLLEMVANTGYLPLLGGLALEVGPMHGMLRHLQLPPGLKARFFYPEGSVLLSYTQQSVCDPAHAASHASTAPTTRHQHLCGCSPEAYSGHRACVLFAQPLTSSCSP